MEKFGQFIVGIVLIAVSVIIAGFYFMKLWGWFIVPAFPMLPVLTYNQAIGVSIFLTLIFIKRDKKNENKDFSDTVGEWVGGVIFSLILFGMAYIIYLFIR